MTPSPNRVCFFVDGFNLYHSICSALLKFPGKKLKWLDLKSLFNAQLDLIHEKSILSEVHYFSAYAYHIGQTQPDKIAHHKIYVRALTASGVIVNEAHFKKKIVRDSYSGQVFTPHEEKETDVAIACAVLEGAAKDLFDTAVLVTGDTDLRPLVRTFKKLYDGKMILFSFPFDRKNNELTRIASDSFTLSVESYEKHQFPDKVRIPSGKVVHKPEGW